jgi:hypothetical protein
MGCKAALPKQGTGITLTEDTGMTRTLFPLGQLVATPGASDLMERHGINGAALIRRHATGDWGELCREDCAENERAVLTGGRILSAYGQGESRIWIITDAVGDDGHRAVTTILRPEDY